MVTMPLCYSIAYGVIAGCASYLVLFLGNTLFELMGVPFGQRTLRQVMIEATPEVGAALRRTLSCSERGWEGA